MPGYRNLSVAISVAVCRPAISCRTPVPVWNRPAVGGQGTGIARVLATGPTGCQPRLCRPDIPGRRFTPRPACLPAEHPCIKPQTEPDRRAGLPDRKRRDEGTGQDGGRDRGTSRRAKVFLPLAMPGFLTFFSAPVSRKFRRNPSGGFPARFGRAFRFGRRAISFQMTRR